MSSSMRRIIATILCVAMTLTNTGVSTFATSIDRITEVAKQLENSRNTVDYRFYELKYEKRISYLMKDDEDDGLKEEIQQSKPSSGVEEKTNSSDSPSFDAPKGDKSVSSPSDAEGDEDDKDDGGSYSDEPEDDGDTNIVSGSDDTDTATISDADDKSSDNAADEPEDDTATTSDADTTVDRFTNDEAENDDNAATTSDLKELPLDLEITIAFNSKATLFGVGEYTLPKDWYNVTNAGAQKGYVQSITIAKYPTAAPTTYNYDYGIPGSDGLHVYANVTGSGTSQRSDVTIYAPDNKTIYTAADSSEMFNFYSVSRTNLATINELNLLDTSKTTNMEGMFYECRALASLDLSNFNTANVTNMERMFYGCRALTSLDLSNFNTANVTSMQDMFNRCSALTSLNVSRFDTSKVTTMEYMFYNCYALISLDLRNFNTANVTNMSEMFAECHALISLDVRNFVTASVSDMEDMFSGCSALTSLDVSSFDTSNVTNMTSMFSRCRTLTSLYLSNFKTANVTNMRRMFNGCHALTSLDLSNFNTSIVTNMNGMFEECQALRSLDLSNFVTASASDMSYMFRLCSALTSLDLSNFNTANVTNMRSMFGNCSALTSLDLSNFNTANVTNMRSMFERCFNLTTIIVLTSFVTTAVTDDVMMFSNCPVIEGGNGTKISDIYAIDRTNAENSTYAKIDRVGDPGYFTEACYTLPNNWYNETSAGAEKQYVQSITIAKYPTAAPTTYNHDYVIPGSSGLHVYANVTGSGTSQRSDVTIYALVNKTIYTAADSSEMFAGFSRVANLDVSLLDTSKTTNMERMFYYYRGTSLDLSNFVTASVSDMEYMFSGCSALTSLDVSSFDTSNVTNMEGMFESCNVLISLDVSSFDTSNVTDMIYMFNECRGLTTIIASTSFVTTAVTAGNDNNMFNNCLALEGGNGTKYSDRYSAHATTAVNKTYAKIDRVGDPGYFTEPYYTLPADWYNETSAGAEKGYVQSITIAKYPTAAPTTYNHDYEIPGSNGLHVYANVTGSGVSKRSDVTIYAPETGTIYTAADSRRMFCFHDISSANANLEAINGLNLLDTSKTTNMAQMFDYYQGTTLDLSNFNTSRVTNMVYMFYYCRVLTSLNLSNFNTANVTNTSFMFYNCQSLTNLDLSNFVTASVSEMSNMFGNCRALTSLDLSNFNTANVTNMSSMFSNCLALTSLDLSNFNTAYVIGMEYMFRGCSVLTTIIASTSFVTRAVWPGGDAYMFTNCNLLEGGNGTRYIDRYTADSTTAVDKTYAKIDRVGDPGYFTEPYYTLPADWYNETSAGAQKRYVRSITIAKYPTAAPTTYTHDYEIPGSDGLHVYANVTGLGTSQRSDVTIYAPETRRIYTAADSSNMFNFYSASTTNLATINELNLLDTSKTTNMERMFYNYRGETLDLSNFNTSRVTNMRSMFSGCSGLTSLDVRNFVTASVSDMSSMFKGCRGLTSLNVSSFDTSNVTDMNSMFYLCYALRSLDLTSFDTSNVTNMNQMFYNCAALTSLNVSRFDTSKVTDMRFMFGSCRDLTSLDLRSFDTSNVTTMNSMFHSCYALENLNLSNFVTASVSDMSSMFSNCYALNSLNVSSFDTSNVTDMHYMFGGCRVITSINVSNFDTSKVTDMHNMFNDCRGLTTIIASTSFVTTAVTAGNDANMFANCGALDGGAGTTFAARNVADSTTAADGTYAWIDGRHDRPGYFRGTGAGSGSGTDGDGTSISRIRIAASPSTIDYNVGEHFDPTGLELEVIWNDGFSTNVAFNNTTARRFTFNPATTSELQSTDTNITITYRGQDVDLPINIVSGAPATVEYVLPNNWYNVTNAGAAKANVQSITISKYPTPVPTTYNHDYEIPGSGGLHVYANVTSLGTSQRSDVTIYAPEDKTIYAAENSSEMFRDFEIITNLDLNMINTSKVTNMSQMFFYCQALTSLDLSNFNTASVSNMSGMFANCQALTSLNVSNFDTSNITDMSSMFDGCYALTSLDVSSFNTSKVTNMSYMFYGCYDLTSLDVSSFNTSKVTNMSLMFFQCYDLTTIIASTSFVTTAVTAGNDVSMFMNCYVLEGGNGTKYADRYAVNWTTAVDRTYAKIDRVGDPGYFTEATGGATGEYVLPNAWYDETLAGAAKVDIQNITIAKYPTAAPATYINYYEIPGSNGLKVYRSNYDITIYAPEDKTIYVEENANRLFGFMHVDNIVNLNMLNTSRTKDMSYMFGGCNDVMSLDVSSFDTSNVTNMNHMFSGCKVLTNLDVSGFVTASVSNMGYMFNNCQILPSIDVSNFDTSNVTNMGRMFSYCQIFTSLDVTAFDTSKVTDMNGMFRDCPVLTTIIASTSFVTTAVTAGNDANMFANCGALDGGAGTTFAARNIADSTTAVDGTYAWIDGRHDRPGYFRGTGAGSGSGTDGDGTSISRIRIAASPSKIDYNVGGHFDPTGLELEVIWNDGFSTNVAFNNTTARRFTFNPATTSELQLTDTNITITYRGQDVDLSINIVSGAPATVEYVLPNNWYNVTNAGADKRYVQSLTIAKYPTAAPTTHNHDYEIPGSSGLHVYANVIGSGTSQRSDVTIYASEDKTIYLAEDCSEIFAGFRSVTNLDVSLFDTSRVTDMYRMFHGCQALTSLDVSNFDTSNVTTMNSMFYLCFALTSLDLTSFDTSNVTNMKQMFYNCAALTSLNVSSFDTSKVTDMRSMFGSCRGLTSLNVSNFDTSNVTTMNSMFISCHALRNLNLSNFVTASVSDMSSMFSSCYALTSLNVSSFDTSNVTNMNYMFGSCRVITSINVSNFDTSKVTDMHNMFNDCRALGSLNVSNFDTSKVTDMRFMFRSCRTLTSLDLSNFNTTKVINMESMFDDCIALRNINLSSFDTSKVTDMHSMFNDCRLLTSIDVSNFVTASVSDMNSMFNKCQALASLDLSNFNTANVTNMENMFNQCRALTSLNVSNFDTANVTNMENMFNECQALIRLDLSSFDTSNVTDMINMFSDCQALTTIIAPTSFVTTAVTAGNDNNMFNNCLVLEGGNGTRYSDRYMADSTTAVDKTYAKIDRVGDPGYFTEACYTLPADWYDETQAGAQKGYVQSITIAKYPTAVPPTTYNHDYEIPGSGGLHVYANVTGLGTSQRSDVTIYAQKNRTIYTAEDSSGIFKFDTLSSSIINNITGLNLLDTSKTTNMYEMFRYYLGDALDVSTFDTSKVTNMEYMFAECLQLTSLDVRSFVTASVSSMAYMFANCQNVNGLNLSSFNTSNVNNMSYMFMGCQALASLDLSNFNTSNVTNMLEMFNGCSSLNSIDLSDFDTINVVNMSAMFSNCQTLTSLDLSNFNTSNVTDMRYMFNGCPALTSLDLSNFNTSNVTNMSGMFNECRGLTTIIAPTSFVTTAVTAGNDNNMFNNCLVLEGGNGTRYSDRYMVDSTTAVDRTYAKIDRVGDPGYFTDAPYTLPNNWYNETSAGAEKGYVQSITIAKYPTAAPTTYNHDYEIPGSNGLHVYANVTGSGASQRSDVTIYAVNDKTIYTAKNSSGIFKFDTLSSSIINNITGLNLLDTSKTTNMYEMFRYYLGTALDVSTFDTSKVTNMRGMFSNCGALINLDLSSFDTSKVTNMEYMFAECLPLTSLDVRSFVTASVSSMAYMFANCQNVNGLNLSSFNTSNVNNMSYMFMGCQAFASLDLSNFNTSNVTDMREMFNGCSSLNSIDLSDFDTINVVNMSAMFSNCQALISLDLSNFNTSNVINMSGMFNECQGLTTIIASTSFVTTAVTAGNDNNMFNNCLALEGGNGTRYSDRYIANLATAKDKTYAWIDGRHNQGGYFRGTGDGSGSGTDGDGTKIHSIKVKASPSKIDYNVRDHFDPSGLVLEVQWTDGYKSEVTYDNTTKNDFTFNPATTSELQLTDINVAITYRGKNTDLPIIVMPEIDSITITQNPKSDYTIGQKFNPSGLKIKVNYIDGTTSPDIEYDNHIAEFTFDVSLDNPLNRIGNIVVTVTYRGKQATFNITVNRMGSGNNPSSGYSPSGGGRGGSGGGSAIGGGIPVDEMKTVIESIVMSSDYDWIYDEEGQRDGVKLKKESTLAKSLMSSDDYKECYKDIGEQGYIQIQNGFYNLQYAGAAFFFGFNPSGKMLTGFVKTKDDTKHYWLDETKYEFVDIGKQNSAKYFLYNEKGVYKGIIWTLPITVGNMAYTFDVSGRVLTETPVPNSDLVPLSTNGWDYNPVDGSWKYFSTDSMGKRYYIKDEVKEITENGVSHYYIFGEDQKMKTGLTEYKGKTYYLTESGQYKGAVYTGLLLLNGEELFFDDKGVLVSEKKEVKALNTTQ